MFDWVLTTPPGRWNNILEDKDELLINPLKESAFF